MLAVAHALQGGVRLALPAGAHHQQFGVFDGAAVGNWHDRAFWYPQNPLAHGDFRVVQHAAAIERDFASGGHGGVNDHLRAVHVAGEGRNEDTAGRVADNIVERLLQRAFCGHAAFDVSVAAIAEQQQHAGVAQLA